MQFVSGVVFLTNVLFDVGTDEKYVNVEIFLCSCPIREAIQAEILSSEQSVLFLQDINKTYDTEVFVDERYIVF